MNGPEHFAEGEKYLRLAENSQVSPLGSDLESLNLKLAELHFAAAQVAATAAARSTWRHPDGETIYVEGDWPEVMQSERPG